MGRIDTWRLVRLALAGAAAGLLSFVLFDRWMLRLESVSPELGSDIIETVKTGIGGLASTLMISGCLAALAGGFMMLVDELGLPARRVGVKVALASGVGAAAGMVSAFIAQILFGLIGMISMVTGPAAPVLIGFGRACAWGLIGAGSGAGIGYAVGSKPRAVLSAFGGMIGGFVGGVVFEVMARIAQEGSSSGRFIGFTVMGTAIGAAISLFEDAAKQCWVRYVSGPREGRTCILTPGTATIGRDELADIPVSAQGVAKEHAFLRVGQQAATLEAAPGEVVTVNGSHITTAVLADGDLIRVGPAALRFHRKAGLVPSKVQQATEAVIDAAVRQVGAEEPVVSPRPQPALQHELVLTVTSGPHTGERFRLQVGSYRVGRDSSCDVPLPLDSLASRGHAQLDWTAAGWTISDLGSTNGTYVNSVRVSQQGLQPGDQVTVGQTLLRADAT